MKLPRVSGKQTLEALLRLGFNIHRIRGSHYILKHPQTGRRVTIPYHREVLALKTLDSILKQAAITREDFCDFL